MSSAVILLSANSDAILGIVGMILVLCLFVGSILLGAWIDGRRQKLRNQGLHPVTTEDGEVKARDRQP